MTSDFILTLVRDHFNLEGSLEPIYSELDAVYRLISKSGNPYVVKISNPGRPKAILDMETRALSHLNRSNFPYALQRSVLTNTGEFLVEHSGYHFRIFEWIDALILADCAPQTASTRESIGTLLAHLSTGLRDFEDPAAYRFIKWDPSEVSWIKEYIHLLPPEYGLEFAQKLEWIIRHIQPRLDSCPKQINYNDANDYNLLCTWNGSSKAFEGHGIIDCLDMVYTHRINELAIAAAYTILDLPDPLQGACDVLGAYHLVNPLTEVELEVLYAQILSRLMISLTVSAINRKDHPGNTYLQITDERAWKLLDKWIRISPQLATYTFRAACGLEPVSQRDSLLKKLGSQRYHPLLDSDLLKSCYLFDFSIGSTELGNFNHYIRDDALHIRVQQILTSQNAQLGIGRYGETRPFYTTDSFMAEGNEGPSWRTVHLGLDLFTRSGTRVYAPLDGIVHSFRDNANPRDYGPTLILEHQIQGIIFYTLYGHLSRESLKLWTTGQTITAGQYLGNIGSLDENGGWPPHLHFQIMLDLLDQAGDFPGVAGYEDQHIWKSICPDPGLLTGIFSEPENKKEPEQLIDARKKKLGYNLSLSYSTPLFIQRGMLSYLLDHTGRRYLDTVNNVAHCGHEHPGIVATGQAAMAVLNTNTRYLHKNILDLADALTKRLDPSLSVCYFTNSGTEANELAIRLAKNYTGQQDILTMQWAYHGNSELMIGLSSYKFDRKGGSGKPAHTHVIPMPDPFRGIHASKPNPTGAYLKEIQDILDRLQAQGIAPVGLFAESILSCGGQVVYPPGFLRQAVDKIRKAGGLYIADEVQTGLGRTGKHFCAYEMEQVIPDIVTFGKPLGNGHPIGAVVCSQKIAEAFNNGMEYFNTFGGNPVSCAIGSQVMAILADEKLMEQALDVGDLIKTELNRMKTEHPILADIRGSGYFLGFEFIKDHYPAPLHAKYFVERMKSKGILMSTDGPDDNVIKFKPPMCFNRQQADQFLQRSREVLNENFLRC